MTGFEKVPTQKLKFVLSVGEAGLLIWKGKRLAEVKAQVEAIKQELAKRGVVQ
jgi:hypothetical protein